LTDLDLCDCHPSGCPIICKPSGGVVVCSLCGCDPVGCPVGCCDACC
jgi:hypothetical protein